MKNRLLNGIRYIIVFLLLVINHIDNAVAQRYIVGGTFVNDTIIHPFGQNDTLYSLKISGSVTLNSDTSLVRVIVGNQDSLEYIVYESYPLISVSNSYSFLDKSDETSFLNSFIPSYLKFYLINAYIDVDSLTNNEVFQNNLDSLQLAHKLLIDSLKFEAINRYIQTKNVTLLPTPSCKQPHGILVLSHGK